SWTRGDRTKNSCRLIVKAVRLPGGPVSAGPASAGELPLRLHGTTAVGARICFSRVAPLRLQRVCGRTLSRTALHLLEHLKEGGGRLSPPPRVLPVEDERRYSLHPRRPRADELGFELVCSLARIQVAGDPRLIHSDGDGQLRQAVVIAHVDTAREVRLEQLLHQR